MALRKKELGVANLVLPYPDGAEVIVEAGVVRFERKRGLEEILRRFDLATLQAQQPRQVERGRIIRLFFEDLDIKILRQIDITVLMGAGGLPQELRETFFRRHAPPPTKIYQDQDVPISNSSLAIVRIDVLH